MSAIKLLRFAFYVAVAIAVLHGFAMVFFLYGYIWWLDTLLHFSAGLCLGLASLGVYYLYKEDASLPSLSTALLITLLCPFLIGIAWEIFEYFGGLTDNSIGNYPLDTVKDLMFDVGGGYVAYLVSRGK